MSRLVVHRLREDGPRHDPAIPRSWLRPPPAHHRPGRSGAGVGDRGDNTDMNRKRKIEGVPRCKALIRKRDTYRYTGRTKSGFEMHYKEVQCEKIAVNNGYCKQHDGPYTIDCRWASATF